MQTLETVKERSQESFANIAQKVQAQPDEVKTLAVTAGSAVVGALVVTAAAGGLLAIVATLAAPPVALLVGAVGGGLLGWNYIHQQQGASQAETPVDTVPGTAVAAVETSAPVSDVATMTAAAEPAVEASLIMPVMAVAAETESVPADVQVEASIPATAAEPLEVIVPSTLDEITIAPAPPTPVVVSVSMVADDLEAINGIGPVYAGRLRAAGIQTFAQLAELSPERVREIIGPVRSGHLIEAERWIADALQLSASIG